MQSLPESVKKGLKTNSDFKQFTKYIISCIKELDSVEGLEDKSDEEAGQEAKVRYLAAKKLTDILSPVVNFHEKSGPTVEEVNGVKKKFGV